jgi:peptidoglycan LD-endopeptidase CwlK
LFDSSGNYITGDAGYKSFSAIVLPTLNTIEWGGNWHSLQDYPHYQLKAVSESVAVIRQLFEEGNPYV